jgi:hypothetical protein
LLRFARNDTRAPRFNSAENRTNRTLFAVAQGGYLGSGDRCIGGGSQPPSRALAGALTSAGGEILLGRTVPRSARERFWRRYAERPRSISLFSVTFKGKLSRSP